MTALAVVQFAKLLLQLVYQRVAAHHGGREGNPTIGVQRAIEQLESLERASSKDLESVNMSNLTVS